MATALTRPGFQEGPTAEVQVAPTAAPALASVGLQTDPQPGMIPGPVEKAMARVLQVATAATIPPHKDFGPSELQVKLPDPKEEKEDGFVSETSAMKGTLESLRKSLASRDRQIHGLSDQFAACRRMH